MPLDEGCYIACVGVCTVLTEGIGAFACIAGCLVACNTDVLQNKYRFPLSKKASEATA